MAIANWIEKHSVLDGYPNMDFEDWYQKGIFCHYYKFPVYLQRIVFNNLANVWETNSKKIKMWHIRAFVLGLSGNGRLCCVEDDYEWPTPPKGWDLMFSAMAKDQNPVEIDFGHPVSRIFWSEDNHAIPQPRLKEGHVLSYYSLEHMGLPCLTPCHTAYISNDRKPYLAEIK